MVGKSIIFGAIAAVTVSSAQAAMLINIQGAVAVNAGGGYQPVVVPATVVPGERMRTGDGSADIVYDNGATVHVAPNQVVLVNASAPSGGGAPNDGAADPGIPTEYLVAGGLVAGGGIAAGVILSQSKHHDPASP